MVVDERPVELTYEIDPGVQDELLKFAPGQWVALTPSKIIAVRDSATDAYQAARDEGVDAPILVEIPTGHPGSYYY